MGAVDDDEGATSAVPGNATSSEEPKPDTMRCCEGVQGVGHVPGCRIYESVTMPYRIHDPKNIVLIAGIGL